MVLETIFQASVDYRIQTLGVDPYLSRTLTQRLTKGERGYKPVNVIEIPQGIQHFSPPTKHLELLIRKHEMLHEHNTCARWCFNNVRCYVDGNENMKPMKDRSTGRIDIVVAWIIAMAVALLEANKPSTLKDALTSGTWTM
jgi:phage terminase large subunit-like protein